MKREDQIWRVEAADLNSYYKGSYSHQNIMVSDKLTADYISRDHHRTLRKTLTDRSSDVCQEAKNTQ